MEIDAKEPPPAAAAVKEEEGSEPGSGPPPVSSPPDLAPVPPPTPNSRHSPSFSQLLAGAMSPRGAQPVLAVPIDGVGLPVVAVPCFLAPASLLDSSGFTGQFTMTHQAVLATVTAQAQMQLQTAYSSPEVLANSVSQPVLSSITPLPLQSQPSSAPEENVSTPEAVQPLPSDQKSPSTQIVMKTGSTDGYNWGSMVRSR
ncbi:putative WRKY transcription factor 4 isoform X1 [Iris pallida]|uniref:WRKY transcription factor 4 isoform X1 n=1 Tax=Iris pallida TaxID=29817 RepID=A0AAX6HXA6_IRIPA|nr:putative WRKY transcription factor 4 isoform X1 [Iris pallida]